MFGVFSMWMFGIMTYLLPRIYGRPWYSNKLLEWHFWLSAVGVFVMFLDLGLAGVFQGYYWSAMEPWDAMLRGSMPFWITRVFAGLAMFGGFICFCYNIFMTFSGAPAQATRSAAATA
ncbi:MAG: cbb3-type cytochrome c oxidase subunit I, partial [Planctomycetales bacterium]|nr:cbb3-type cytochrome c oxidase subunit I [Planctomycetales bacterium]